MAAPLILLFGLPRSGTTWIGKIFDSHPQTLYRHEPDSWGLLNSIPLFPEPAEAPRYTNDIMSFIAGLPHMHAAKVNGSLPIFTKDYYSAWRLHTRRLAVTAAKIGARVFGECPVPTLVPDDRLTDIPLVWKSIESVGRLGTIVSAIAAARGILLIRHPCGYVASVQRGEAAHKFGGDLTSSEDYGIFERLLRTRPARERGLTIGYLKSLTPVERLAWRWVLYNEKAMSDIAEYERARVVRYEDVCAAPMDRARAMFDFTHLSWDAQTEAFIHRSTRGDSSAYYGVVRDPQRAAGKWKQQLSDEERFKIEAVAADTPPGGLYFAEAETPGPASEDACSEAPGRGLHEPAFFRSLRSPSKGYPS